MDEQKEKYLNGRGAQHNPHSRFERVSYHAWDGMDEEEEVDGRTRFISIFPKTIVNKVTSPDVGMEYSLNPYQGCEHGCTYCYARPTHEYWGYSAGVEFERVILVKENAPELLRQTLEKKSWEVKPIVLSGNTDCYQPCERKFGITRQLLEVCLEYRQPVGIITKNTVMERDFDLIEKLASLNLIAVNISITSLDDSLRRKLEPRTATVAKKLRLIETLSGMDVPVHVLMAPVIPALNDHEILSVAQAVAERGANDMGYITVRLNGPNQAIFERWLQLNYPDRMEKVLNQLKDIHGGDIGDSTYGRRMRGQGSYALNFRRQFEMAQHRFFAHKKRRHLRTDLFRIPNKDGQLDLFGE